MRNFQVSELLEMIDDQQLVLPEFQRDFDWGDERIVRLLATVIRRWPAGSLLLQSFHGKTFYRLRTFDGGPPIAEKKVRFVTLDGQQRLTALYHAIYDSGNWVFAIRAGALQQGASIDDLEESIHPFSRKDWDDNHREATWDADEDWIPFYALRSAADFFAWRDDIVDRSPDEGTQLGTLLSDAYRNGLASFHTTELPAVVVEEELEPEAIARIFERVNRTGLTLSAFDLMVAKTFQPDWNLRDKWDEATVRHPVLRNFFKDDGMPVVKVICLKTELSVREGDALAMQGAAVRADWDDAVEAMASALTFLGDKCGVIHVEWLAYEGMAITLGGIALEHDLESHVRMLKRWYLSRAFGLAYDVAANTVAVDQYQKLHQALQGAIPLPPVELPTDVIREATRKRRGALWRAFLAALRMHGARDLITGRKLSESAVPVTLLKPNPDPKPGTESPHLRVMNVFLATPESANELRGSGVAGLRRYATHLGSKSGKAALASQFAEVPRNSEALIKQRSETLVAFLEKELGPVAKSKDQ